MSSNKKNVANCQLLLYVNYSSTRMMTVVSADSCVVYTVIHQYNCQDKTDRTVSRHMAQYDMAPDYSIDPNHVDTSHDSECRLAGCGV